MQLINKYITSDLNWPSPYFKSKIPFMVFYSVCDIKRGCLKSNFYPILFGYLIERNFVYAILNSIKLLLRQPPLFKVFTWVAVYH
jgi:hypothetical protein